jgi:hypothetical protein
VCRQRFHAAQYGTEIDEQIAAAQFRSEIRIAQVSSGILRLLNCGQASGGSDQGGSLHLFWSSLDCLQKGPLHKYQGK